MVDDVKGAEFCRDRKIPCINALLLPRILHLYGFIFQRGFPKRHDSRETGSQVFSKNHAVRNVLPEAATIFSRLPFMFVIVPARGYFLPLPPRF